MIYEGEHLVFLHVVFYKVGAFPDDRPVASKVPYDSRYKNQVSKTKVVVVVVVVVV